MANHHAVRAGVLFVAFAALCPGASAQSSFCTPVDYPGGMPGRTYALGINNKGHVVGWYGTPTAPLDPCECDEKFHGFVLIDGRYTPINVDGAYYTTALGINDAGQIVGDGYGPSFADGYLRQPNGQITPILGAGSGGNVTHANAINNAGTIVGTWNPTPAPGFRVHGFIMPVGGAPQTIDLGPRSTSLGGISNAGVVVGNGFDESTTLMFTWTNGALAPVPSAFGQFAVASGINKSGKIVGTYSGGSFTLQDGLAGDFNCPGSLVTYVNGTNDMGQLVGLYWDGTTYHGFYTPPIALVDPVPDLTRTGGVLTTDRDELANKGRAVQGAAADGATVVLVRIPTPNAGDLVTLTVLESDNPANAASSVDEYGGVGTPAQICCEFTISVVSEGTTTAGPMAFATYRVPKDFPRESVDDTGKVSRDVFLRVDVAGAGSSIIPVHLLRPPVALVHGIWARANSWNEFTPLTTGALDIGDKRFQIKRVSYANRISVSSSTPSYGGVGGGIARFFGRVRENSLGFEYNAGVVVNGLQDYIKDFKSGKNPEHLSIAAVQADLVVHSMGGDVARAMAVQPDYLARDNYGKGVIHKMITLDTPHLGTPVANRLLLANAIENNGCFRTGLAIGGNWSFLTASGSFGFSNGAVGDLQVGSPALQLLAGSATTPTARIASQYANWGTVGRPFLTRICKTFDSHALLAKQLADSPTRWPDVFTDSDDPVSHANDGLVSVTSQTNGGAGETLPGSVQHSTGLTRLGFTDPAVLQSASGAPEKVILLLNQPSYKTGGAFDPITP
jgi:uncharacterized membrane protein/pimeloyl-ACP methyl ester carboxylesterase